MRGADRVFEQLAGAILRGDLPPRSPLPPERLLGKRFGVSRILIRQAVHRLADLGLVHVRQGGASLVLDPEEATDLRLLALFYRLAPGESAAAPSLSDMIEKQYLQGLSMVSVASRRASPEALKALARLVQTYLEGEQKAAPLADFEERFWRGLAKAGGNRIFRMEVAWWYEVLPERPLARPVKALPRRTRLAFYAELTRRLVARGHAVEYYLETVRPILETLF
jgi:GntR family transcriptional regulator, transcriptional repressor for pyruvate dehydrogenase complex